MRSARAKCLAAALCLGAPGGALAAAPWPATVGVQAMGRAGAALVDPGDPTALAHNPAALAGLRGLHVLAAGSLAWARQPPPTGGAAATATGPPSADLWVAYSPATQPALTLAAGWYAVPAWPSRRPGDDEVGRQASLGTVLRPRQAALGLALALPWAGLRLGLQGSVATLRLGHAQALAGAAAGEPPLRLTATASSAIAGLVSLAAAPTAWLQLALALEVPEDARLVGAVALPPRPGLQGGGARLRLRLPQVLRAGLRLRGREDRADVEVAVIVSGWGRARPLAIDTDATAGGAPLPAATVGLGLHDSAALHLGGRLRLPNPLPDGPPLALRAGVAYAAAATDAAALSAADVDLDRATAAVGLRLPLPPQWGPLFVEAALAAAFGVPREVRRSAVRSLVLDASGPRGGAPVGAGRYAELRLAAGLAVGLIVFP